MGENDVQEHTVIDKMNAIMAASIVRVAAETMTSTVCSELNVILANKRDAFWLEIVIGRCPFSQYPLDMWYRREGETEETIYSHYMRLRIPESALQQDEGLRDNHRLKAIGEALGDIWFESCRFNHVRQDRAYIIPYLDDNPTDVRLVRR